MIDNKKVLAIIPARGGSKGIPHKNIRLLNNKPLINWTIEAATSSNYVDKVILSSDSKEIINIAFKAGCEAPFIRPKNLSTDEALTIDVIDHAINNIKDTYQIIVILQPTSPFRGSCHIDAALEKMNKTKSNSLVSVTNVKKKPEWMYKIDSEFDRLIPILDGDFSRSRRQDIKDSYALNGAIYAIHTRLFMDSKKLLHPKTIPYRMDQTSSIDIDTIEDLNFAEFLTTQKND